ncbi:MAG: excinuclease ABC subunit UvrC [Candidatus Aenigmarchaeota archaeon]|nr:excinuclease ABC subunit UvrC [Candidatus Aenigmarchaeota archaeon]
MTYVFSPEKSAGLSHPGVYLMKDSSGKIIYIGKAKDLKKRIRSYFGKSRDYKTQKLVEKISDIEFVLTDSEAEAYILESNLIKRYRPAYNIELKDQQRYTYLRITDEKYPRLLVARRMRSGKFLGTGRVFGPFTSGSSKLLTIGTLRKAFKVRICNTMPKKACLEYHLGNCHAPCEFEWAQKEYAKNIAGLESVIGGKESMKAFSSSLREQMGQASKSLDFERAIELRDTLSRLGSLGSKQKMERVGEAPDEDYFGILNDGNVAHIMKLSQRNGVIRDRDRFSFDVVGDNTFGNFLFQYYTTTNAPKNIIVNVVPENKGFLERQLSETAGFAVRITRPTSGKKKEMISLILRNIEVVQGRVAPGLLVLQQAIDLPNIPSIIECFDISNFGEEYAVGSMSRFVDGKPDKSGYRRFRICTVSGRDDFSMITEIVERRYLRLVSDKSALPDLVLIDGGKGQLSAALGSLERVGAKIPCVSIAKEREEVFVPGKPSPIIIDRKSPALKILQHARDEAHRFGVSYNRHLRKIK